MKPRGAQFLWMAAARVILKEVKVNGRPALDVIDDVVRIQTSPDAGSDQ